MQSTSNRPRTILRALAVAAIALFAIAHPGLAQITPAEGYTPPNDDPAVKVGGTLFLDYTYTDTPEARDADGNLIHPNAFNLGRAYINVTGQLHHLVAFRITPDVTRETGTGSSLNGSYTVRMKYAYAQLNLDDWMPHGTWLRFGMQQTPYVDFNEGIYRYRFQGQIFVDREGFLVSSDLGLSTRLAFPSNYGDIHVGRLQRRGIQPVGGERSESIPGPGDRPARSGGAGPARPAALRLLGRRPLRPRREEGSVRGGR